MAYAAIANGIIKDKSKKKQITATYVRPEIDLSDLTTAQPIQS